jgi:hypothetical protein
MSNQTLERSPFNIPDIVKEFFKCLPTEDFNNNLKLNRVWYQECRRELFYRWDTLKSQYWEVAKEAEDLYHKSANSTNRFKILRLDRTRDDIFIKQAFTGKTISYLGFDTGNVPLYNEINWYIKLLYEEISPIQIPGVNTKYDIHKGIESCEKMFKQGIEYIYIRDRVFY